MLPFIPEKSMILAGFEKNRNSQGRRRGKKLKLSREIFNMLPTASIST